MSKHRRRPKRARLPYISIYAVVVLVVAIASFAFTNAILGVNAPPLDQKQSAITPTTLEPQQCRDNGVIPTGIIEGNTGTGNADLLLGTNGRETISGQGGNDCLVGGNGNDRLQGGTGTNDVCVGGPGTDTFTGCEHQYQ